VWIYLLIACSSLFEPPKVPAERETVRASLTGNFRNGSANLIRIGTPEVSSESSVQRVRFDLRPGFQVSGALWTPNEPTSAGVVVAHGHYGQGKSSAEAQEIAHRLAANGAYVLAVDTPGVEEWDVPGRRIHFDEGAHNRGFLIAGGSSALALQLDVLRRGLDVLEAEGATKFGVTGASGGAVQSFYLGWLDDRIHTTVLASFPRMPREAAASGCTCDQIPGHAGPDPDLLGQLKTPSLWMSEVEQKRPAGLDANAQFKVLKGPHSYTVQMQRLALDWFSDHLGTRNDWVESVPAFDLNTGDVDTDAMSITQLPLPQSRTWVPEPIPGEVLRAECSGQGPTVLLLGSNTDPKPLNTAGFRTCAVWPVMPPGELYNQMAWAESIGRGRTRVDALAGGVQQVADREQAALIWAHRGWGLVAAATGIRFVVHDPISSVEQIVPSLDAPWVHVPGAWSGAAEKALNGAMKQGGDPAELVKALQATQE
jgi:dienelactone hydrolase